MTLWSNMPSVASNPLHRKILKALSEASQYNRAQLLPLLKKRWNLKRYPCLLESQKRRPLVQTILTANALTSHQSDCLRLELEELGNRSQ